MNIEKNAFFKIDCGLFVLSANDNGKDNGCIINTVMQITEKPYRLSVAVNKSNYTAEIINKTGKFNISVLDTTVPFSIFERFGFKSGRDTDKLDGFGDISRSDNGILYLTEYSNAYFGLKVIDTAEYETHFVFTAEVTEAKTLSDTESVTYQYYFDNIKPKPEETEKKGWVCKICGYIYKGEKLPEDFICPLCKHPASDFEPIE